MGSQLNASEKAKYSLNPASLTKRLDSCFLRDCQMEVRTLPRRMAKATLQLSLTVESVKTVGGGADKK